MEDGTLPSKSLFKTRSKRTMDQVLSGRLASKTFKVKTESESGVEWKSPASVSLQSPLVENGVGISGSQRIPARQSSKRNRNQVLSGSR